MMFGGRNKRLWIVLHTLGLWMNCSTYPKHCSDLDECDKGQVCDDHHCVCNPLGGLEFDEEKNSCVKLAEWKCSENGTIIYECVKEASCNPETGNCECNPGYVSNVIGECRRGYGDPCSSTDLCSVSAFLVCDRRKRRCGCKNPATMMYDHDRKICVSLLGGGCELVEWMGFQKQCITNAECTMVDGEHGEYFGECSCKDGFRNFSRALCLKEYDKPCDDDKQCHTGFCGYSNTCSCRRGNIFDTLAQECRAQVNQFCDVSHECVTHATCNPEIRKCECDRNYVSSVGTCIPGHMAANMTVNSSAVKCKIARIIVGICLQCVLFFQAEMVFRL